jgi:hypothetical protein
VTARREPSSLEETPVKPVTPEGVQLVHVTPLSIDVKINPSEATAMRLSPSLLEATDSQLRTAPPARRAVQVAPESTEVQISPPRSTATTFVPLEFDAIENQLRPFVDPIAVQVTP